MGICWVIIYFNVWNNEVVAWAKLQIDKTRWQLSEELIEHASRLVPTIVVSAGNALVDPVTLLLTSLEKWDFSYERVNQQIWRKWISKTINLLVFIVLQIQLVQPISYLPADLMKFN